MSPRTLVLDIETSPNVAHVWALFNQNVSLAQLRESTRVISFAAKWHGKAPVQFFSEFHHGFSEMVDKAYELVDEADILVTYNGKKFDYPHLCREFVSGGKPPPSPVKHVDLLEVVKRRFRFTSNKLDHVTRQLGLSGKASTTGHDLWVRCMAGDEVAWAQMRRYNRQDVRVTDELYGRVLPWIQNHPHLGLYGEEGHVCPACGSTELVRQGYALTAVSKYQRYRCSKCNTWSRGNRMVERVETRSVA